MSANTKKHLPLTVRGQRFIAKYFVDGNAAAAVRRAGYRPSNAEKQAADLMRHPEVRAALEQARDRMKAKLDEAIELASRKTLEAMAAVAYFDVRNLVNDDGSAKTLKQLDPITAMGVAGFKTTSRMVGSGKGRHKVVDTEYRLVNRVAALDIAAKVTGEYKVDHAGLRAAARRLRMG